SMRESFKADKAKGVHARYQWELSGSQGGQWWIDVNDGTYKMGKGKIDNPTVTFITSDKDWVAMSNGKLKGTWAYMTGRLKVRGHLPLKFRLDLELYKGSRPRFRARFSPKEIEVPPDRAAGTKADFERLETGILALYTNAVFAVLNPGILHLQLPLGGYDV